MCGILKKIYTSLSTALLLCLIVHNAHSQLDDSDDPRNTIKINPFGFIIGQYQLTYERFLNDFNAVQLTLGVVDDVHRTETQRSGILIIPEYRKGLDKLIDAPLYLALLYRYYQINYEYEVNNNFAGNGNQKAIEKRKTHTGGLVLGYSWSKGLKPNSSSGVNFIIDVFMGIQRKKVIIENNFRDIDGSWVVEPNFVDDIRVGEGDFPGIRMGVNMGALF